MTGLDQRSRVQRVCAGIFFALIGLFFGANTWRNLEIGSATLMGPGYFPLLLGFCLIGLGCITTMVALRDHAMDSIAPMQWRGPLFVALSLLIFGLTIKGLGFLASLAATILVASFASPSMTFKRAVVGTIVITAFCFAVFISALGVPLRPVGPWLTATGW